MLARHAGQVTIDLGTGDGRLPWTLARRAPDRLFVGIDADAAGMRELSRRALREPVPNLLYVRAAAERLPAELAGTADRLTVVLPWGSLLRAVAGPEPAVLANVRSLCRPDARLTVVLGSDPVRDRAELLRLGLPSFEAGALAGRLGAPYREAGFRLRYLRPVDGERLASWPTRWATRLARGPGRRFIELEAVAAGG